MTKRTKHTDDDSKLEIIAGNLGHEEMNVENESLGGSVPIDFNNLNEKKTARLENLSKSDREKVGVSIEFLKNGQFKLSLKSEDTVFANLSGKMKKKNINEILGNKDNIMVEVLSNDTANSEEEDFLNNLYLDEDFVKNDKKLDKVDLINMARALAIEIDKAVKLHKTYEKKFENLTIKFKNYSGKNYDTKLNPLTLDDKSFEVRNDIIKLSAGIEKLEDKIISNEKEYDAVIAVLYFITNTKFEFRKTKRFRPVSKDINSKIFELKLRLVKKLYVKSVVNKYFHPVGDKLTNRIYRLMDHKSVFYVLLFVILALIPATMFGVKYLLNNYKKSNTISLKNDVVNLSNTAIIKVEEQPEKDKVVIVVEKAVDTNKDLPKVELTKPADQELPKVITQKEAQKEENKKENIVNVVNDKKEVVNDKKDKENTKDAKPVSISETKANTKSNTNNTKVTTQNDKNASKQNNKANTKKTTNTKLDTSKTASGKNGNKTTNKKTTGSGNKSAKKTNTKEAPKQQNKSENKK